MIKAGYKLVKSVNKKLMSYTQCSLNKGLRYIRNKWTYPTLIDCEPYLFVFNDTRYIADFLKHDFGVLCIEEIPKQYKLYKCEYEPYNGKTMRGVPKGTRFASKVKLLERVDL